MLLVHLQAAPDHAAPGLGLLALPGLHLPDLGEQLQQLRPRVLLQHRLQRLVVGHHVKRELLVPALALGGLPAAGEAALVPEGLAELVNALAAVHVALAERHVGEEPALVVEVAPVVAHQLLQLPGRVNVN